MTKYAANAMLATRISFMNEIANLCERVGADVDIVRKGIGRDARIGPAFLFPGPGLRRLVLPEGRQGARPHGAASATCRCACSRRSRRRTTRQKHRLFDEAAAASRRRMRGARIAVWGLAFKPNTDDMREAPALVADRGAARPRARRSSRTIPSRWTRRSAGSAIAIEFAAIELRRARPAPTRSSSSPTGTSTGIPTSRASRRRCGARRDRRPQPVRPPEDGGARLHLLLDRAREATVMRVLITGARGLPRLAPVRPLPRRRPRGRRARQLRHRATRTTSRI